MGLGGLPGRLFESKTNIVRLKVSVLAGPGHLWGGVGWEMNGSGEHRFPSWPLIRAK